MYFALVCYIYIMIMFSKLYYSRSDFVIAYDSLVGRFWSIYSILYLYVYKCIYQNMSPVDTMVTSVKFECGPRFFRSEVKIHRSLERMNTTALLDLAGAELFASDVLDALRDLREKHIPFACQEEPDSVRLTLFSL